ncbi:MAG: AI-2E family transporter [Lentimicrobiaceae bacterium]|nr:AI-2E family transporter [Lentimicrobiaceae bacterium]MCB9024424.1 AI-2E family transporter [Lentimicrobiaceae bacterium]MCO5265628.1 AI-2E family transporter [Lentimicrobium sp.]HPG33518.1 AI-2E family transporter [Lentimicrobium sp.]
MNRTARIIFSIVMTVAGLLFVWYFSNIVFYILAAAVISVIGRPLVEFLNDLKVGRFHLPHFVSTLLTLLVILFVFVAFFSLFVPLVAQQARLFSNIDTQSLAKVFAEPLASLDYMIHQLSILEQGQSVRDAMLIWLKSIVDVATFSNAFNYFISFTGSFLMAVFSILFMSFFFIKDEKLLYNSFLLLVPEKHNDAAVRILAECKRLLTRYFLGLCMELASMVTLITLGLTIFGVQNALLIGFIGGLMNIIPYLGPLIGGVIGIVIGILGSLSMGAYTSILPLSLTIAGVFAGANLIDNIILQPVIYSNSVKAHPIEIFLVIIIAGSLFGITGMILAVPVYTVLRIVLREFFSEMRLVRKLTENM